MPQFYTKLGLVLLLLVQTVFGQNYKVATEDFVGQAELADKDVRAIFQDRNGNFWFGTRNSGVMRFDGKSWQAFTTEHGLLANGILAIVEDRAGAIWCAGGGGVQKFDDEKWTAFALKDDIGLNGRVVFAIREDADGRNWIGSSAGASVFDGTSWQNYTTEQGLSHNVVHDVLAEASGTIWFATRKGGLSAFDDTAWQVHLQEANIRGLLLDDAGRLWAGTASQGAYSLLRDGTWHRHAPHETLIPKAVDRHGGVWFATEGAGAFRFYKQKWFHHTAADGLVSDVVYSIFEDRDGIIWLGTDLGVSQMQMQ